VYMCHCKQQFLWLILSKYRYSNTRRYGLHTADI
jgi:hypothetical protein